MAVLALAACVVVFFWPITQGRMFSTIPSAQQGIMPWAAQPVDFPAAVQDDQATLGYPWHVFTTRSLRAGSLPFWDPHEFGGYPFLTNGSSGVLNPVRVLLALTTVPGVAHELFSAFQLLAGGLFAYLLARDLRLRPWGALLASLAWTLSSWNMGWLHLEVVSPIIALFPLGMLTVGRAVRSRRWGWTALAAVCLAWAMVSAHLLFALVNVVICVLYGFAVAIRPLLRRRPGPMVPVVLARLARLVGVGVGSLALAAPVVLSTVLSLQDSQRSRMTYAVLRDRWLAAPSWFLTTFVPPKLPMSFVDFNDRLAFAGTATALLAVLGVAVGLRRSRQPAVVVGALLSAGLFLVAVGTPLTWLVFHLVPGMDVFRPYSRLEMWWPLGIGLMAGAGLDWLVAKVAGASSPAVSDSGRGPTGLQRLALGRPTLAAGIALLIVAVTAVQLLLYARQLNPPFPERSTKGLFPETPLLTAMRPGTSVGQWPARSVGLSESRQAGWAVSVLFANSGMLTGIDSMAGYDSSLPTRTTDVVRVLSGENPGVVLATGLDEAYFPEFDVNARLDLLARMGVSQLALAPTLRLDGVWAVRLRSMGATEKYRGVDGVLVQLPANGPRLVGGTELTQGRANALHAFLDKNFDHTAQVVLESDQKARLGSAPLPSTGGPAGTILEATRGGNSGRLVVDADRPAWLMVPESWDPGWSATVNGSSAPVLRTNYYQRAVLVPAGRSVVELRYRPRGWTAGVAICLVSVAACAVAAGGLWLRRWRSGRSLPATA